MGERFRVLVGVGYVPAGGRAEVRREAGDVVADLSPATAGAFLAVRAIEPAPEEAAPVEAEAPAELAPLEPAEGVKVAPRRSKAGKE